MRRCLRGDQRPSGNEEGEGDTEEERRGDTTEEEVEEEEKMEEVSRQLFSVCVSVLIMGCVVDSLTSVIHVCPEVICLHVL